MSTNEAAERLREFLSDMAAVVPGERTTESEALRDLDAALAHERSAGAASLDVNVLAEAIMRHDADDSWPRGSQSAHDRGLHYNIKCAEAIAAEYARLASEGTEAFG